MVSISPETDWVLETGSLSPIRNTPGPKNQNFPAGSSHSLSGSGIFAEPAFAVSARRAIYIYPETPKRSKLSFVARVCVSLNSRTVKEWHTRGNARPKKSPDVARGLFCLAASMPAAAIPNTAELSVFTRRPKMDLSALTKKAACAKTSARVAFALSRIS